MSDEFNTRDVIKAGVRSTATSVPGLAPIINLWHEHEAVELSRRVDKFFQAFANEANRHEERIKKLSLDMNAVQERVAILELGAQRAVREPIEPKRETLAYATLHLIIDDTHAYDWKASMIEAVDTLTVTDLRVLGAIVTGQRRVQVQSLVNDGVVDSLDSIIPSLAKLEARGLILKPQPDRQGMNADAVWRYRQYVPLNFGDELAKVCGLLN